MTGGTLVLSKETELYPDILKWLEKNGFSDIEISGEERDSLNYVISDLKPRLVIMECGFYQCSTPYMMKQLLKTFPDLTIAVVSVFHKMPAELAMYFIINGAKSYVNIHDGLEEFRKGMDKVRDGIKYISPEVVERIALRGEMPEPVGNVTEQHKEIIRLLYNGFKGTEICSVLNFSEQTLYVHKRNMYTILNVRNENEIIRVAEAHDWVDPNGLHFYGGDYQLNPIPEKKLKPKIKKRQ